MTEYIPNAERILLRLIFNIRRIDSTASSSYKLKELTIDIPIRSELYSDYDRIGAVEPLLTSDYTGPGVRMISNQRLVPVLDQASDTLQIRIIPRSSSSDDPVLALDKE
jgi:hypothetical protein